MRVHTQPTVRTLGDAPSAHAPNVKACGHVRHVGTCPCCQRAQLARWHAQATVPSLHGRR
jgi:hypothetical protein